MWIPYKADMYYTLTNHANHKSSSIKLYVISWLLAQGTRASGTFSLLYVTVFNQFAYMSVLFGFISYNMCTCYVIINIRFRNVFNAIIICLSFGYSRPVLAPAMHRSCYCNYVLTVCIVVRYFKVCML